MDVSAFFFFPNTKAESLFSHGFFNLSKKEPHVTSSVSKKQKSKLKSKFHLCIFLGWGGGSVSFPGITSRVSEEI